MEKGTRCAAYPESHGLVVIPAVGCLTSSRLVFVRARKSTTVLLQESCRELRGGRQLGAGAFGMCWFFFDGGSVMADGAVCGRFAAAGIKAAKIHEK